DPRQVLNVRSIRHLRPMTSRSRIGHSALTLIAVGLALAVGLRAETGYDLWLRYVPVTDPVERSAYRQSITAIAIQPRSPTGEVIAAELGRGLHGLLGVDVPRVDRPRSDGALIVGTPS